MINFYSFRFLSRTVLSAGLTGLLLVGSTDAATAQQHRPSFLKSDRSLGNESLTMKEVKANSLAVSLTKHAVANTSTQPLTSVHYSADGANWRHETSNTYTYDGAGRVTSVVEKNPDGSNFSRETWAYDQYGNETENKNEQWNGSQWEINGGWKSAYTYNSGGKIIESVDSYWNNNNWQPDYRSVYTYNTNGNLEAITEYDREGSNWIVDGSYTLTYASANTGPTSLLYMEPNRDGVLVNSDRITDIVWHTFSNSTSGFMLFDQPIKSYIEQEWENGAWVNSEKYDAVFGDNNSYVAIEQEWENGAWVNSWRTTITYDAQGNITLGQDEERVNGNWVIYGANKYIHTYNSANNLTETIQQNWDTQTNAFYNSERIVYSNFQVITSAPLAAEALITEVYPNPTDGKITLSYKQPGGQATLQITDMTGRIIFTKQLPSSLLQQELDLSNFPSGLYMLRLSAGNAVTTRKVMKL